MKNFKNLIREAHLGNPLNETAGTFGDGVSDKTKAKYNEAAMDEYGKPFAELSIGQKQEVMKAVVKYSGPEFRTDFQQRRQGDLDDEYDGMTDYQRGRMDEELKLGVKYELPTGETGYIMTGGSKDPKDWKFSANKESYLSVKDKLKPTKKQPGKFDGAYDLGMGKGHHIDEGEYRIEYEDEDDNRNYIKIKASSEEEAEQKSSGLDGFRTLKSIELVDEGTCGYGEDGVIGDKPAGPHLNEIESGDVVTYKGEDHTVQRIEDDDLGVRVYIRPNEKSYYGGKKDIFWVKPEDLNEDMNDPVLVKARAAKMAAEKEKAKQAALDKKYGSSFMDKLDAEIGLKQELQDLKDEREQLMIDMEQEAEPEGGVIADRYGSRLNDIDAKMALIKSELEDLRMYESVNEEYSDLDLYYRKGYKDFTGLVNRIVGEKDLEEKRKLMHVYINILPKASREKKFKLKQSINKMGPSQIDKFAYNILMRDSRMTSLEEDDELNVNVDNANDNYAKAIDAESRSGAYESLQETLRKNLANRLK